MNANEITKYNGLILKFFLGLTVLFWGYEKLVVEKLTDAYTLDYGNRMLVDVHAFLQVAGWWQIIMGLCLIIGLLTRIQAAVGVIMGLVTMIVPGFIFMRDVPHFAHAFAFTGGSLVLFLKAQDSFSLDYYLTSRASDRFRSKAVQTARLD